MLIGNIVLDTEMEGLVLDCLEKIYNNSTVALKDLSYVYPSDYGVVGVIGPN